MTTAPIPKMTTLGTHVEIPIAGSVIGAPERVLDRAWKLQVGGEGGDHSKLYMRLEFVEPPSSVVLSKVSGWRNRGRNSPLMSPVEDGEKGAISIPMV